MARTLEMDSEREDSLWREVAEQIPGQYVYNRGAGLIGAWYVGIGVAPQAVEYLRKRNVLILGFEGFNLDGTWTRPDMDAIAHLCSETWTGSYSDQVDRAARIAVDILEKLAEKPLFIEFGLQFEDDDLNEWLDPRYVESARGRLEPSISGTFPSPSDGASSG